MLDKLRESIELLKQRIKFNLELIHQNESKIKDILKEPVSEKRSKKLNRRFSFNKQLLKENKDALRLQQGITYYLENYKVEIREFLDIVEINQAITSQEETQDEIGEIKKEDCFDLTITGEIGFDNNHPYFNDESFLNELLAHFTEKEEYEMCSTIIKQKKDS